MWVHNCHLAQYTPIPTFVLVALEVADSHSETSTASHTPQPTTPATCTHLL